jgi:hypothetical protein
MNLELKQKEEEENKLKSKLKQDKINYHNTYLHTPYKSMSELNFNAPFNINSIKDEMLKKQSELIEKTKKDEKEKYNRLLLTEQQTKDKKIKDVENKIKKEK